MNYNPKMKHYNYMQWTIDEHMMEAIHRYVLYGIKPGDFLYNALCNRFYETVIHADAVNLRNLPAYPHFFEEFLPRSCWGSVENVRRWMIKGGLNKKDEKII